MMNVISSEIYKICKNKFFYAMLIFLLGTNIIGFISGVKEKCAGIGESTSVTGFSIYQESYNADGLFYIILIFVSFIITSEYANGCMRQMTCRGIARWKLVLGRYIAMTFTITIVLFTFGIISLTVFTLLFQLGEVNTDIFIKMNFGILSIILGTTAIATFLSYLIKNVGITILASILIVSGSTIFVSILSDLTKNTIFNMYSFTNMRKAIVGFSSNPQDIMKFSTVFLLIALVLVIASAILFSKRDVD